MPLVIGTAQRMAVVGAGDDAQRFVTRVTGGSSRAPEIVGFYNDRILVDDANASTAGSMLQIDDLVERSRAERIDAIVLTLPLSDIERIKQARMALQGVVADIYLAADVLDIACRSSRIDRLGCSPVIKIDSRPITGKQAWAKQVSDRLLAVMMLAAALPFLLLIALAIRLDSAGPVLFRQPRIGYRNQLFTILKFRTMYAEMTDLGADRQTTRGDLRITRVGRILRKFSLDELPQFINVIRGEMSLVGPRPHAPNTKAGDTLFHEAVEHYGLRHRVKPGMTGWAQINGWRGQTETSDQLRQRVLHDLYYIDNWSFWLDLKILALTPIREFISNVAF